MGPEEIQAILDMLAERLGPMATKLFAMYMRQVVIEAYRDIILALVFLPGGVALARYALRCSHARLEAAKEHGRYSDEIGRYGAYTWGAGAIAFMLIALGVMLLIYAPITLLNPEYAAIQRLLHSVK